MPAPITPTRFAPIPGIASPPQSTAILVAADPERECPPGCGPSCYRLFERGGEVPERSNGAVSKTVVPLTGDRGFESLPLRQKLHYYTTNPIWYVRFSCINLLLYLSLPRVERGMMVNASSPKAVFFWGRLVKERAWAIPVEPPAVNRLVAGSSPARGANKIRGLGGKGLTL